MLTLMCILAGALHAQGGPTFWGQIPEGTRTYHITMAGQTFDAAMKLDGKWVTDRNPEIPVTATVEIYPDTPWAPTRPIPKIRNNIDNIEYINQTQRESDLDAAWGDAGYALAKPGESDLMVLRKDRQFADRARNMTRDLLPKTPAQETAAERPETPSASKPGFLRLWGGHILILAIAGASLAVVLKKMVLA